MVVLFLLSSSDWAAGAAVPGALSAVLFVLLDLFGPPLASDEPLAAGPAGLALSIVWLFFIWLLSGSDAFGASLIVSGPFFVLAFCSPGFNAGATFSAGPAAKGSSDANGGPN